MDDRALYVYGVVPGSTPSAAFADVHGVAPDEPIALVAEDDVAAIVSSVREDEFVQENLQDVTWLAKKARAHDEVLSAALVAGGVVPFRFGAIYRDEQHVHDLLRERRDLGATLARLEGTVELGVIASFADPEALRERVAADRAVAEGVSEGRAYMLRKQLASEVNEAVAELAAERAAAIHERLAAEARDARANPVKRYGGALGDNLILNGAYLVDAATEPGFRDTVAALARDGAEEGLELEVTGPWPPYNFVAGEDES